MICLSLDLRLLSVFLFSCILVSVGFRSSHGSITVFRLVNSRWSPRKFSNMEISVVSSRRIEAITAAMRLESLPCSCYVMKVHMITYKRYVMALMNTHNSRIDKNQRTNGPVNAHLISWPSKAQNIQNLENIW